jgi:hypothetical protein
VCLLLEPKLGMATREEWFRRTDATTCSMVGSYLGFPLTASKQFRSEMGAKRNLELRMLNVRNWSEADATVK